MIVSLLKVVSIKSFPSDPCFLNILSNEIPNFPILSNKLWFGQSKQPQMASDASLVFETYT